MADWLLNLVKHITCVHKKSGEHFTEYVMEKKQLCVYEKSRYSSLYMTRMKKLPCCSYDADFSSPYYGSTSP